MDGEVNTSNVCKNKMPAIAGILFKWAIDEY
jgi:hypothetical protein